MPCCVAIGCSVRKGDKTVNPPITFHHFPSDEELRRKWIQAIRREDWEPSKRSRLCSKHFREEDFDRSPFYTILKKGAVPSRFEGFTKHLQKQIQQQAEGGDGDCRPKSGDGGSSSSSSNRPVPAPEIPFVEVKEEADLEWEDEEEPPAAKRRQVAAEFESAGSGVASKLSRMSPLQAIYAESLISSVLRRGLLGRLKEHTDICDNRCNRRAALASQSAQVSTSIPLVKIELSEDEGTD